MLRTSYNHLNKIQKGSFGEAFAKMAFTLEGFEVYSSEYDDRGIDFVVRNASGTFFSIQVKTTDRTVNPFIASAKFQRTEDFIFCAVRIIEGDAPTIYIASGTDWGLGLGCLHFNSSGGKSGPYYEMRFSRKYSSELESLMLTNYSQRIRE